MPHLILKALSNLIRKTSGSHKVHETRSISWPQTFARCKEVNFPSTKAARKYVHGSLNVHYRMAHLLQLSTSHNLLMYYLMDLMKFYLGSCIYYELHKTKGGRSRCTRHFVGNTKLYLGYNFTYVQHAKLYPPPWGVAVLSLTLVNSQK